MTCAIVIILAIPLALLGAGLLVEAVRWAVEKGKGGLWSQ